MLDPITNSVFSDSEKIIGKLHLLAVFFENEFLYKIYTRTLVIHKLFENNKEIDCNKLSLFHLQFTETIIELLRKIKLSNEKNVLLNEEEAKINEALIEKLSNSFTDEDEFSAAVKKQTKELSESLFRLYNNLSGYSPDPPFSRKIEAFSLMFAKDFFVEISRDLYFELSDETDNDIYKNGYAAIERRLMGLLNKQHYDISFYGGLKWDDRFVEIYKLNRNDSYFVFCPGDRVLLFCELDQIKDLPINNGLSKKDRMIKDLKEKNKFLKSESNNIKTHIPSKIQLLLEEYHAKIEEIDFLDFFGDFDVQANMLKTMLNTDGF